MKSLIAASVAGVNEVPDRYSPDAEALCRKDSDGLLEAADEPLEEVVGEHPEAINEQVITNTTANILRNIASIEAPIVFSAGMPRS